MKPGDVFLPDGPIASALPAYEHRPQQSEMAEVVAATLTDGGLAFIEAGTGTGKSLAYLIPAAQQALSSGKPVVISTNTINLQEQLLGKDIPLVRQSVAPELKAALVKGWQNYLCLYRYEQLLSQAADLLEPGDEGELAAIREWVTSGPADGSRSELSFSPSPQVWERVSAESDTCLRQSCPHFDRCYVFAARKQMEGAHLLVVNHHLLFADVALRSQVGWSGEQAVLPDYKAVIVDEAHHIEDIATDHLGHRFTRIGWRQLMGRLSRRGRSGEGRGVLPALRTRLLSDASSGTRRVLGHLDETVFTALEQAQASGYAFFDTLAAWAHAIDPSDAGERLLPLEANDAWAPVHAQAERLGGELWRLREELKRCAETLRPLGEGWTGAAQEIDALGNRIEHAANSLEFLTTASDSGYVYWVEVVGEGSEVRRLALCAAPIEVGDTIRTWVTEGIQSLVCCSATLAVGGNFTYIRGRLGVAPSDAEADRLPTVRDAVIESPFAYMQQAALYIPSDLPEPTHPSYAASFADAVLELLLACGGRAFVLFTSYAMLRSTLHRIGPTLYDAEVPLWVQGEAPRSQLLEGFRKVPGSVLFGTDSFWEGVDVPGQALTLVIIARLPFEVPTHPIAKARADRMQSEGQNPFYQYSLPRAALKLKQGFGRLIRSARDFGAVVIYDRRLITKPYGRVLLASLPQTPHYVLPHQQLLTAVEKQIRSHDMGEPTA